MVPTPPTGRPRRGGLGRHVQQFKVTSEPVVKKLAIVNYLSSHRMRATICKFYPSLAAANYNSKRTTVLNWVRNRGKLEVAVADGRGQHKKVHNKGVGATLFKELEADIVEWVNDGCWVLGADILLAFVVQLDRAGCVRTTSTRSRRSLLQRWRPRSTLIKPVRQIFLFLRCYY
jgi:hypothetical protein